MDTVITKNKIKKLSADCRRTRRLIRGSFPKIEVPPYKDMLRRSEEPGVDFWAYHDAEGKYIGFSYILLSEHIAYLLYFAIEPACRNRGLGSSIVRDLQAEYPEKAVVVDIEELDESSDNAAERLRRHGLYTRLGFADTGYLLYDFSGRYTVMATKETFDPDEYLELFRKFPECFFDCKLQELPDGKLRIFQP